MPDKLISRDKMMDEAIRLSGPITGDGWDNYGVYALINRQPAVDAVEVVRCKDCKHYYAWPDDYRTCHLHYEIDGASEMMGSEDFCSKGERGKAEAVPQPPAKSMTCYDDLVQSMRTYAKVYKGAGTHVDLIEAAAIAVESLWNELKEERERQRWIPVSERVPDDGQRVLVSANGDRVIAWLEHTQPEKHLPYWCSFESDVGKLSVSYWRPLPEAPGNDELEVIGET